VSLGFLSLGAAPACSAVLGLEERTVEQDAGSGASTSSVAQSQSATTAASATTASGATLTDAGPPSDASPAPDAPADAAPDGTLPCGSTTCTPTPLVAPNGAYSPLAMAEDDSTLYWTDLYGGVYRMGKDGGALTPVYTYAASNFAGAIAVGGANVYWSDNDGVWQCAKTGCPGNARVRVVPVTARNDIHGLTVDDRNAYWTDDSSKLVAFAPLSGADGGTPLWSGTATPEYLVTDGQRVYFTADDGLLHIVGTDGGAVTPPTLGTANAAGSLGVAYVNQTVLWTVEAIGTGQVMQTSTANLAAIPVTAGQNSPVSVAGDGLNVFWLDFGLNANGDLRGCTVLDCVAQPLYSPIETPRNLLVDATSLYWIDVGTGGIWRLPK
jgi:hypothetical protein